MEKNRGAHAVLFLGTAIDYLIKQDPILGKQMELAIGKIEQYTAIRLDGNFGDEETEKFTSEITKLILEGRKDLVVHYRKVGSLSSQALGALVTVWKRVVEAKGNLYVVTEQSHLRSLFESTNLNTIIEIFASEEDFRTKIIEAESHEQAPRLRSRGRYQILDVARTLGVIVEANSLDAPIGKLAEAGHALVAIDLTDVIHLNSSTLGVLIRWNRLLKERGGDLCLLGLSKDLLYYLELVRLPQAITIYETEDEIPLL